MSALLAYLPVAISLLAAVGLLIHAASLWERAHGHADIADRLDVTEEVLDVFGQVFSGHEHGITIADAALAIEKSPQAQDLIAKMKARALASNTSAAPPAPPAPPPAAPSAGGSP